MHQNQYIKINTSNAAGKNLDHDGVVLSDFVRPSFEANRGNEMTGGCALPYNIVLSKREHELSSCYPARARISSIMVDESSKAASQVISRQMQNNSLFN